MQKPKHIHIVKNGDIQWLNVTQNTTLEINWLKNKFNFHPVDLKECLPPTQRPKLVERENYLFMILLFPVYNRKTQEIKPAEVDFFIGHNFLVTVHDSQLSPLREFFTECEKKHPHVLEEGISGLLYEVLSRLLNYCFPILLHISNDIEKIEGEVFGQHGPRLIYDVALIKKNIVNFRKSMQAHKNVIHRLVEASGRFFPNLKLDLYFKNLIDQTREIWDLLENNTDTINALHESQSSLSSYRLNKIIKTLTIISVIFMPLNLTAFLFGMNVPHPLMENPYGFWIVGCAMVIITLLMFLIFRKKRWW
jgi:magnesium transporter